MSQLRQKQSEFVTVEQSVGISLQQFKQKFVFNSNSGPDPFSLDSNPIFLDINQPSPSQLLGFTKSQQNACIILMTQIIFKAGQMLKLPVSTTIVTINIAQYYFTRKSFLHYDFRDVTMGAMFLACKSEETLRRSYQIAAVFDYIFKMYEGIRPIKQLQLNSSQYNYMKEKVLKTQNQILFELGFEVYKLFDIPHRYISGLIISFNKHKQCNSIVQHSWTFLNDIYRTKVAVYFPGQIIAAAAIFMALHKLKIPMPDKPWWILMQASLQQIKQICILTNEMYETSSNNQVNINIVSQILQRVGKQALQVTNVLPVPYYRKIRLENQGLLMKSIEPQKPSPIIEEKPLKQTQKQSQSEEDRKGQYNHREKSKKEKKKDKKKHKSHKYDERSKSRSQEKHKNKENGKFQNDEETPKIKKSQPKITLETVDQIKTTINQGTKPSQQLPQRKVSQVSATNVTKEQIPPIKKSVLSDAKSMLSKISLQIKKIQVKNETVTASNDKKQESLKIHNGNQENGNVKQEKVPEKQNESDSDEQDELLAELIQIKKKNLQKKEETN